MEKTISDYEIIKKNYGERMAKYCREYFPTVLEHPGKLSEFLLSKFAPNHSLYQDIMACNGREKFKYYVLQSMEEEKERNSTNKTVRELLSEAGYDFYECHTEEDIQKFIKYYAKNEKLCTFYTDRLKICHVFFAVKKDVDSIRREDFTNPKREDRYGTSVISIQFALGAVNTLSIKNRYNHTVMNPDATFGNNLDNIAPGLTEAFEREYGLNIDQYENNTFELLNYVRARDGKYYKYNYEINGAYYCPNNTTIYLNGEVDHLDKSRFLLIDYFVIDMQEKTIERFDWEASDTFADEISTYDKLEIVNNKKNKTKDLIIYIENQEPIIITIDENNRIIGYKNNNLTIIDDHFLEHNTTLREIEIDKAKRIGDYFLKRNQSLTSISLPSTTKVGKSFLEENPIISSIFIPNVIFIGNNFASSTKELTEINVENVEVIGDAFIMYNPSLKTINLPKVRRIGNQFLSNNRYLRELSLPLVEDIGDKFINCGENLCKIYVPNLVRVGDYFLYNNRKLKRFLAPSLISIGNYFLFNNDTLTKLSIPKTQIIKEGFLFYNKILWATFPELKKVGRDFLYCNESLFDCSFPSLKKIGNHFLPCNKTIKWNDFLLLTRYKILRQRLKDKASLIEGIKMHLE